MNQHASISTEQPAQKAIMFLVSGLILISLAYVSPVFWMTVLCLFLFAIAAIRAGAQLAEAILSSEIIEQDFGLRLDESQD
ncbi:MAG: hypothetical protein V4607_13645 [Pseudomonadota bacterium]